MKKNIFLISFIFNCLNYTFSQSPTFVTNIEGVSEYKLTNGLQVLLIPDATQNNVVVNIVYHVGSRHEGYGETGMAHLLEHMLFKGSKKFSSIKQTIANKGASANGTTFYDRTHYYEILPASDDNLKWALDMESDRMVNSLMLNSDLQKEFSVVRNEFESGENNPDGILMERIISTMYLWHNYGKSTIGSKEDIEKVPIENLKNFYKKYYQPDNATLIIGGKFNETTTLKWIGEYFAKIQKPTRIIQPSYTIEPVQDGERFVELRRNGDMQYVGVAYHTPCFSDKDYAANDAIIEILTNNPSGILYKNLVETKLATRMYGYSLPFYDPGFTYFSISVPKDKNLDSAKSATLNSFDNLINTTITQEQLDRAKNTLLKNINDLQNKTIDFTIGLTEMIGGGDWKLYYIYRDRVEKLTLAEVQAVANKYYLTTNRTWGYFTPDKNPKRVVVNDRPDIQKLVSNYKGRKVEQNTATFETSVSNIKKNTVYGKLSNGLKYALLEKPSKGNKIYMNANFRVGTETSLTNKSTISKLTATMLTNGTLTKSKKEINDKLDKIKTSLQIFGNNQDVFITMETDKENLNEAMSLLEDILLHPSFDKNEFDKLVLQQKGDLEANRSEPFYVAQKTIELKVNKYPKNHPFAVSTIDEELQEITNTKIEDLKDFYANFYGANNGAISFVGNFESNTIKQLLEKSFGKFNSKNEFVRIESKYFNTIENTEVVSIKDKQNAVCLGLINIPIKKSNPDYEALTIANELLGGGSFLSSRIPQRLRENEGMSYGAGSFLNIPTLDATSTWGVYAIFNPKFKNKIDSALHEEIEKAVNKGFTADELSKIVPSWLQERKTSLAIDNKLVNTINQYLLIDRDINEMNIMEEKVKNLKLEEVNNALKKYIDLKQLVLVYVGDFK